MRYFLSLAILFSTVSLAQAAGKKANNAWKLDVGLRHAVAKHKLQQKLNRQKMSQRELKRIQKQKNYVSPEQMQRMGYHWNGYTWAYSR